MWFDAHCLLVTTPLTEVKWEIILQSSSCVVQYLFYMADGIGFGGVGSSRNAYDKVKVGASLTQIYSMMVHGGPGVVSRIRKKSCRYIG